MQNFGNAGDIFSAKTADNQKTLAACYIKTPLEVMLAIGDEDILYLLDFLDNPALEKNIKNLKRDLDANIIIGNTAPILMIQKELAAYFSGTLQTFETPLHLKGTSFQKEVWQALTKIPFGQTNSYLEIAQFLEKPSLYA